MFHSKALSLSLLFTGLMVTYQYAAVSLPSIFGDHMVLQRELRNPVWGKAAPNERVVVRIAEQRHEAVADSQGDWRVALAPMSAGGPYELHVEGTNQIIFQDVLVGEVWLCSGQSNMEWSVAQSNHADVELAAANFPQIRLISIPKVTSQDALEDFEGNWKKCSPTSVRDFSAVGYFFGRTLHHALDVPIGLVDNAWGGSPAEAWVPREVLEEFPRYAQLLETWDEKCVAYSDEIHQQKTAEWKSELKDWEAGGRKGRRPRSPKDPRVSRFRPANIFNGVVTPIAGYGMRGMIWYQGESNAHAPEEYAHLFPLLIHSMRTKWGQGDFPFYWVQLADFKNENKSPEDHNWARIREAQTQALDLVSHSGQAVIIDAGEARDIHPRDKQTVANRLVRIALARDYGFELAYQSPRFQSMEVEGNKVRITFDYVSPQGLRSFDVREVRGFAVAGEDKKFVWADAKIVGKNQVEVWSDLVDSPVAVRYAWAVNPVCNLYDQNGLPVTPFRTDSW